MTEQERINENLQRQIDAQNARIDNVLTKVDIFIEESKQQREDMRRLWERQDAERAQREADMKAMQEKRDADMKAMQEKRDADMKAMQEKIDANQKEFTKQLHSNFVQTLLGVGAIMAAIGGLIISMIK
ncbi:MAG: hypothetical protein IJG80_00775 [Selenomonadaceae bacterium]|nr:hypothetical protein [Selenomonadaceae bacterium]MBQ3726886.1 hypothetical protein [Selenomonadaceae bacterium]